MNLPTAVQADRDVQDTPAGPAQDAGSGCVDHLDTAAPTGLAMHRHTTTHAQLIADSRRPSPRPMRPGRRRGRLAPIRINPGPDAATRCGSLTTIVMSRLEEVRVTMTRVCRVAASTASATALHPAHVHAPSNIHRWWVSSASQGPTPRR